MRNSSLTAYFREHFSARIFLTFSILIIVVTLAFTVFFFRHQSGLLTERTESKGELLASLLAHNARLGVFAENADMLSDPVNGIMENREVLSVAVYSADGKLLALRDRPGSGQSSGSSGWDTGIVDSLKKTIPAVHFRDKDNFVFWMRVALRSHGEEEDAVYFNASPTKESEQIIGFVRVMLDGHLLQENLHTLLLDSILIGAAFLLLGSVLAYFLARRVTNPLNRLTEGVNAFGTGGKYKEIAVETGDEIGNLAAAFNNMVDSLRKREAEKAELEEQLRHSQKMEAIGTLAGGVAHDFNNILTAINGYGILLKLELAEGSKLSRYADQIVKAGERAATLTRRLLAFTRKQIINPLPVNLNEIVRNIEKMLERLITEDIELRVRLEATDPVVLVDSGQIDQVLINLVTNARDAMPQGGTLTVTTGIVTLTDDFVKRHDQVKGGVYVVLTVSDSGGGMDENVRARIFDPFFTTKEVGKGTGLGLSMVYGIVKQHNGIIEVDSETDKGTSFRIYLPLVEPSMEERQWKPQVLLQGNSETVLVAEDDAAVMGLMKGMLENNGYNVIAAADGVEAIQEFINHQDSINLAILDVIMPRKNGREVYDEIIRIKPDVKALFVSGYTRDVIDSKDARKEGIDLIFKPVQPEELLAKMREALEGLR